MCCGQVSLRQNTQPRTERQSARPAPVQQPTGDAQILNYSVNNVTTNTSEVPISKAEKQNRRIREDMQRLKFHQQRLGTI